MTSGKFVLIDQQLLDILRCPHDHSPLALADFELVAQINRMVEQGGVVNLGGQLLERQLDGGLVRCGGDLVYPVIDGIPVLLPDEAIDLTQIDEGALTMSGTIFQKIIDREIPADIVYEDEHCLAFYDVAPQAPTHVLVIPKKPIISIAELADEDALLLGHLWLTIRNLAQDLQLDEGYRVVVNCGEQGGQTVDHLHFHLLGGRPMTWPPG